MSQPCVSILIAAHNAAPWLAETLESALAQTWPNVEIILVDDGSNDDTAAIAETYVERGVRVIRQQNAGACAARNRALAEATGAFVQYLDADDVIAPEKIVLQMARLANEQDGTVATGPWVRFTGDIATADCTWSGPDWRDFEPAAKWLAEAWQGRGMIPLFAWLIPRVLATSAGPWSEDLLVNQDGEYMARVLVRAQSIAFCPGAWGYYRSGFDGSVSKRRNRAALESLVEAATRCEETLRSLSDDSDARAACAGLWQHTLFLVFNDAPDLARVAEERVAALGGSDLRPSVMRPLKPIRDYFGWKSAFRIQRAYTRSGVSRLVNQLRGGP